MAPLFALVLCLGADHPSSELREALTLGKTGDFDSAQTQLEALVFTYPTWELPRLELAQLLLRSGRKTEEARVHLEIARRLAPQNPRVHYLHGLALADLGNVSGAVASLRQALLLRESYQDARFRLAGLYAAQGLFAEAAEAYRLCLEGQPESPGLRLQLATALEKAGRREEAEREYLRIVREHPEGEVFRDRLIEFYRGHGQPQKARALLRKGGASREKRPLRPSAR